MNRLCECGHFEVQHGGGSAGFRRCGHSGCRCPHFGARRVCRACAGWGIAFDYPTRYAQVLRQGAWMLRDKRGGPDNRVLVDTDGKPLYDRRHVCVDFVYPGIEATHRLEARINEGYLPRGSAMDQLAAELLADPGEWWCHVCYGHGRRHVRDRPRPGYALA